MIPAKSSKPAIQARAIYCASTTSKIRLLGSEAVKPGDDVEAAARRILREKSGKHVRFYDPISYRGNVV